MIHDKLWNLFLSSTSSITRHEWNANLITLKDQKRLLHIKHCHVDEIKNGIKWASLLKLSFTLAISLMICMDIQCAFCCYAFLLFFYTLSHSRPTHSSMFPPKNCFIFIRILFFFAHTFFVDRAVVEQFNFR